MKWYQRINVSRWPSYSKIQYRREVRSKFGLSCHVFISRSESRYISEDTHQITRVRYLIRNPIKPLWFFTFTLFYQSTRISQVSGQPLFWPDVYIIIHYIIFGFTSYMYQYFHIESIIPIFYHFVLMGVMWYLFPPQIITGGSSPTDIKMTYRLDLKSSIK